MFACEVQSRSFPVRQKDTIDTSFRVGDYVPVVWLPNELAETNQIYEFLEITPDGSLLRREAKPAPLWQVIGLHVLFVGFFFFMFWNAYATGRYEPNQSDWFGQERGLILILWRRRRAGADRGDSGLADREKEGA